VVSLPVGGLENVMATLALRLSGPDFGQYLQAVTILIGVFWPLCQITISRCRQPGQRTSMPFSNGFPVRSAIIHVAHSLGRLVRARFDSRGFQKGLCARACIHLIPRSR
jgi:hypothetical protein